MGELGVVRRYHYWSNRSIQHVLEDNDIALNRRLNWRFRFPQLPFIAQFELGEEARDLRRNEVARKIETAIGLHAVEDFVTPPPVSFAKGIGHMEIARTTVRTESSTDGVVAHFAVKSSNGALVHVCLFGSMDNTPHYISTAPLNKAGWSSSAWYAIEELIHSHGTKNTSQWDDDESIAMEALKIALHQGETGHTKKHKGKPWTRGFTIGGAEDVEWFAVVYKDVVLSKDRWSKLDDEADRIVIGAPLWIRTSFAQPITLYHKDGTKVR
jgi:hypothetical protein